MLGDGVRLLLALLIFTTSGGANAQYPYNHAPYTPRDPLNVASTPHLSRTDRQHRCLRRSSTHTTRSAPGWVYRRSSGRINSPKSRKTGLTI